MRKRIFKYNPKEIKWSKSSVLTGVLVVLIILFIISIIQRDKLTSYNGDYVAVTERKTVDAVGTAQVVDKIQDVNCYSDPNNSVYPYNLMSADWGGEIYEDGYSYYSIPKDIQDIGGCLPEVVQVYLWRICKDYNVDYSVVLALIERESKYKWDATGDGGESKGYMQINEKWHIERMEKVGATDLYNPYHNVRVGVDFLSEIVEKYGSSGYNCILMVYNMGESTAKKYWEQGIYSTLYSKEITARAQEIKQEIQD